MPREILYTTRQLMDEFKKLNLPVTHKATYLKYERMGVLLPGKYSIINKSRLDRLFTKAEIEENIKRLVKHGGEKYLKRITKI